MLVEADRDAEVEIARLDRHLRAEQRRPARSAAIAHIDELDTGQAQPLDHRIGIARRIRTAIGELDVGPLDPSIPERFAHRKHALVDPLDAVGSPEGMYPYANDAHIAHAAISAGSKAGIARRSSASSSSAASVKRIGIPIARSSNATLTSRASTIVSPGNAT